MRKVQTHLARVRVNPTGLLAQQKIPILVKPGAKVTEILGMRDGRLHIALKSPPVEGKANEELCKFLSKLTKKKCAIVVGATSKRKIVECN